MFHSRARVLASLAASRGVFRVSTVLKHVDSRSIASHVFLCVAIPGEAGSRIGHRLETVSIQIPVPRNQ